MPVRVAVSLGDPSGIGPEVTAGALAALRGRVVPLVFGDASFARVARGAGLDLPVVAPGDPLPRGASAGARDPARRGRPAARDGPPRQAARPPWPTSRRPSTPSRGGHAGALCTAPLAKAQVALSLPGFVGHTEWLEARGGGSRSVMMLAGRRLRVALVTNHLSLRDAIRRLTPAGIAEVAAIASAGLRRDMGIARPRIAIAGLNPHAGEGGAFGDEESRIVAPAVARARAAGVDAHGPFPPDSVYFRAALGEFDAVVALYHDQGLIPVKLLDAVLGDSAVNVTLGTALRPHQPRPRRGLGPGRHRPGQRPEHAGGAAPRRRDRAPAPGRRGPMTRAAAPPGRGRTFRRIRIGLLLGVLVFTVAWGATRSWHRWSRGNWERPLQVGLVLLSPGADVGTENWRRGRRRPGRAPRRGDGALAGPGRLGLPDLGGRAGALERHPALLPTHRLPARPRRARRRRLADGRVTSIAAPAEPPADSTSGSSSCARPWPTASWDSPRAPAR